MNGRVSKMLRRLNQSHKEGKKGYNLFTHIERGVINADYKERGDFAKKQYTANRKRLKYEQISNS